MALKIKVHKLTPKEVEEAKKILEKRKTKIVHTEKEVPINP